MLQSSGAISFGDINEELRKERTSPLNIGSTEARYLAGVPSGPIKMSDFYGKGLHDINFISDYANMVYNGKTAKNHLITKRVPNYDIPDFTSFDNYSVAGNTFAFQGFNQNQYINNSLTLTEKLYMDNETIAGVPANKMYAYYSMDNYTLTLNKNDMGGLGNIYLGEDYLGSPYAKTLSEMVESRATEEFVFTVPKLYINTNYVNSTLSDITGYKPTRNGFQFTGFSTERSGSVVGNIDNPAKHFKSGTTLYAQWIEAVATINLVMEGKGYTMNDIIKVPLVDKQGNPDISKTAKFDLSSIPMPIAYVGWEFEGYEVRDGIVSEDGRSITVSYDKPSIIIVKFKELTKTSNK